MRSPVFGAAVVTVLAAVGCTPKAQPLLTVPEQCREPSAVVVSVGDILLGSAAKTHLKLFGYGYPFRQTAPLLATGDLVVGNLEAPITRFGQRYMPDKKWSYRQPPQVASALHQAGFDILALANNHVLDYGPQGLEETLHHLQKTSVSTIGAGRNLAQASAGVVRRLGGNRVGLLAYMEPYGNMEKNRWFATDQSPGCSRLDTKIIAQDIKRLRQQADTIIVSLHYGKNYAAVTPYQQQVSRQVIDLGADGVNGHHSHTAQPVELYRGKPIIYSLGNFAFGTKGRFPSGQPGYGLVARYVFCSGQLSYLLLDLIATNNRLVRFQPSLVAPGEAKQQLQKLLDKLGKSWTLIGSTAVIALPQEM